MSAHTAVRIEGGLLSADFLDTLPERTGQRPADFGLDRGRSVLDEATAAWSDARYYWDAFRRRLDRETSASPVTITREQWVIPLLETLGYAVSFQRSASELDGRRYSISHRAGDDEDAPPVHIVGHDEELGRRNPSRISQMAPHALVQDYLNRSDHLWGLVTNGWVLRLLRDSTSFTRPTYIEFDLRTMFEAELVDEFLLLYRLAHRTRLPQGTEDAAACLLETYHQETIEEGGRIRDALRDAVERAIVALGNGFLRHPNNPELREAIRRGELQADGLYQELLYLIYRLLFLMVAEERNLLQVPGDGDGDAPSAYARYERYMSVSRLRALADQPLSAPERFEDLYLGLRTLFRILHEPQWCQPLGLAPLNGELFSRSNAPHLDEASLSNRDLLDAMGHLSTFVPPDERVRRRVNYGALDVEELGSVYESLLDLEPLLQDAGGILTFGFGAGTERKTTGSYYTPRELVNELVSSALEPVIQARLAATDGSQEARQEALLDLTVCDPAAGSGHFLLAAARRIGMELARVRVREQEPAPEEVRLAVRDAITHCIYGVDRNPLAVDLCKVALWIEGCAQGMPLTFLDYRIRCGDSLVGVFDLDVLSQGIPDEAYEPLTGDDKRTARALRDRNREEREGQLTLEESGAPPIDEVLAARRHLLTMPEDTPEQIAKKRLAYETLARRDAWRRIQGACDLWTAAFFAERTPDTAAAVPTSATVRLHLATGVGIHSRMHMAHALRFFHWPLEFPEVLEDRGGFDVVLGNPPWERIKLQEKEWFATRAPEIAQAPNAAARKKRIQALPKRDAALHTAYQRALHDAEATSELLRNGGRFPLCGQGDINTYAVFAELARDLLGPRGRAGIIVPSGIATDYYTQDFFGDLVAHRSLASLFDFENRKKIFPAVDSRMKFCLLTMAGAEAPTADGATFLFFAQEAADLRNEGKRFSLTPEEIALINPNTRTCPIFRTQRDAALTKAIYRRVPVLIRQGHDDQEEANPWGIRFSTMFHMSNDSGLFRTRERLEGEGWALRGNVFVRGDERYLPLYEGKMLHQFDHRWATYGGNGKTRDLTSCEKADPARLPLPRYWVHQREVAGQLGGYDAGWLVGFRNIARSTDERTAIFGVLPAVGVGNSMPVLLGLTGEKPIAALVADLSAHAFDWAARHKVGGTNMNFFYVQQFPVLPPDRYTHELLAFILPRVLELTYTAWDLRSFARDCGYDGPPYRWDDQRRFILRCELDALYFHLYGIPRDDVAYILETFPIVREKDIKAHQEFRTQRVILERYDALVGGVAGYRTPLDPPPADPRVAHGWETRPDWAEG